jgi:protein Tex
VKVKVLEVDAARKRISLTMRLDDPLPEPGERRTGGGAKPAQSAPRRPEKQAPAAGNGAMADALRRALQNRDTGAKG